MSFRNLVFLLLLLASGCASRTHVTSEYKDRVYSAPVEGKSQTTIVFLVDGLSLTTLQREIDRNGIPNLEKFFLPNKNKVPNVARTTFPSLTFPAIGSLLTERPVNKNGIYGNTVLGEKENINYEDPVNFSEVNNKIAGKNIFSRLRAKGLRSVSLDYVFQADSDSHISKADSKAGFAVYSNDDIYVDQKIIDGLYSLLTDVPPTEWPDFIFVHLIGLDFKSHREGPNSLNVGKHLKFIDRELGKVFKVLAKAEKEKSRHIVSFLTSDHGFDQPIEQTMDLEIFLKQQDKKFFVLNEGRFAGIYFPTEWDEAKRFALLKLLENNPAVDVVAARMGETVAVRTAKIKTTLFYSIGSCLYGDFKISVAEAGMLGSPWICPEQMDVATDSKIHPFLFSNLSYYFQAPDGPDAVIIPKPGISLKYSRGGQHGGPTARETLVPLLMHNADLAQPQQIPALWDLLKGL
ncbi:MAG: alkaline phosphatase family protein [Bdellovibrionota bacterium]